MPALEQRLFDYHRRAVLVPRTERVARSLATLLGPAESLLDVGCGVGEVAAEVGRRVGARRVVGVDVKVQRGVVIEAEAYDGERLPFADGAFEVVVIADVLHHCTRPKAVLRECLRVARRAVAVKDHIRFGWLSNQILLAMDRLGNASTAVESPGTYFSLPEWVDLVREVGGRLVALEWPLQIHDYPWRLVTQDRHQFSALVAPR